MRKHITLLLILIPFLFLISAVFYWFQIRPSVIKHDCSWVKKHSDAVPFKQGLTEEQLKEKGMIKICPSPSSFVNLFNNGTIPSISDSISNQGCIISNRDIINANKPQEYVSAKDWYEAASPQQYNFCLHDKGL